MMLYHLRRIGRPATTPHSASLICCRHSVTFVGRNLPFTDDRHYKLCSDNFEQNVIISRRHARIIHSDESDVHSIYDDSMNGVFVNDTKIDGSVLLSEGDCVTFGHMSGQILKPGTRARQPESEYQFVFEKCHCDMEAKCPLSVTDTGSADDNAVKESAAAGGSSANDINTTVCLTGLKADDWPSSSDHYKSIVNTGTCDEAVAPRVIEIYPQPMMLSSSSLHLTDLSVSCCGSVVKTELVPSVPSHMSTSVACTTNEGKLSCNQNKLEVDAEHSTMPVTSVSTVARQNPCFYSDGTSVSLSASAVPSLVESKSEFSGVPHPFCPVIVDVRSVKMEPFSAVLDQPAANKNIQSKEFDQAKKPAVTDLHTDNVQFDHSTTMNCCRSSSVVTSSVTSPAGLIPSAEATSAAAGVLVSHSVSCAAVKQELSPAPSVLIHSSSASIVLQTASVHQSATQISGSRSSKSVHCDKTKPCRVAKASVVDLGIPDKSSKSVDNTDISSAREKTSVSFADDTKDRKCRHPKTATVDSSVKGKHLSSGVMKTRDVESGRSAVSLHGGSKLSSVTANMESKKRKSETADMAVVNSNKKKPSERKTADDKSLAAVSRKSDDTLAKSVTDSTTSNNSAVFRIPRKPNREDDNDKRVNVLSDTRCERMKINFSPEISVKTTSHKYSSNNVNAAAALATDARGHVSLAHRGFRHGSSADTLHGTSGVNRLSSGCSQPSCKLTAAVDLQSAKHHLHSQRSSTGHQPRSNAVSTVQSDIQELTPKLPEELVRAGWKLCWSKKRYRWYIFNTRTGTSSWDVPK